jgi:hypothetical protein
MDIFTTNDWQKCFSRSDVRDHIAFLGKDTIKEIEIRPNVVIVRSFADNESQFSVIMDLEKRQFSARSACSMCTNSKGHPDRLYAGAFFLMTPVWGIFSTRSLLHVQNPMQKFFSF